MDELAMSGYGAYVWTCFGLTALVLMACEWRARLRHRHVYRGIEVRVKALGEHE